MLRDKAEVVGSWFILADDLTGAADGAIAFARRGSDAAVSWESASRPSTSDCEVEAFDARSRGLSAQRAAVIHRAVLTRFHDDRRGLFKKMDSTLRGQPAAEIAAALDHIRARTGSAFGVMALAFPDTGRTTVEGQVWVDRRRLQDTVLWRRDHSYATGDLLEMLATADVTAGRIGLATVRSDRDTLRAAFAAIALEGKAIAVCDGETNDDLVRIAQASLPCPASTLLIGSAGFAHAVASLEPSRPSEAPALGEGRGGVLIVVGSLAEASRAGARALADSGLVKHHLVRCETLLREHPERAMLGALVGDDLDAGSIVLVEVATEGEPDMTLGTQLAAALADALAPAASRIRALAVTGGETASVLLSKLGVHGIQLLDEIETGVVLGMSRGALTIPVVTKAGAFGDDGSFLRIANRLSSILNEGTFR